MPPKVPIADLSAAMWPFTPASLSPQAVFQLNRPNCQEDAKKGKRGYWAKAWQKWKRISSFSFGNWIFPSVTVTHGPASFGLSFFVPSSACLLLTHSECTNKRPSFSSVSLFSLFPGILDSHNVRVTAWVHCNCTRGHPLEWKHMWLEILCLQWWCFTHYRPLPSFICCFFVSTGRKSCHMKSQVKIKSMWKLLSLGPASPRTCHCSHTADLRS